MIDDARFVPGEASKSPAPAKTRYVEPDERIAIDRHLIAATCVALDSEGRVLLHRRTDNGRWGLPGGAVEPGESVAAAAEREVFEETGCRVRARRAVGVDSARERRQLVHYPDGNVVCYVSVTVECELLELGPAVFAQRGGDGESHETGWFALALGADGGLSGVPGGAEAMVTPHRLTLETYLAAREAGEFGAPLL